MVCFVLTPRCFLYRHAATTFYQLQRVSGGRRQHARIQEFLSVLFSPQLIFKFKEGFQWFYCWENYTYTLQRIQRLSIIFRGGGGGGVQLFSRGGGPNANFYRNTYMYSLFSRGSVLTLYPPLDPHVGNVIITGQYLSQSGLRPWFVRINDRWGFPNDSLILRTFDTFEKHYSWKW